MTAANDEEGDRQERRDGHRPSVLKASDYDYIEALDLYPGHSFSLTGTGQMPPKLTKMQERIQYWGPKMSGEHSELGQCNVCGTHYRYAVIWRHRPSGTFISTGEDCAATIDAVQANAAARDVRGLVKAAADYGKLARARKAFLENDPRAAGAITWLSEQKEWEEEKERQWALFFPEPGGAPTPNYHLDGTRGMDNNDGSEEWWAWSRSRPGKDLFLMDMRRSLEKYGGLTEGQLEAVSRRMTPGAELGRGIAGVVRAAWAEERAKQAAGSGFVGEVGQKIEIEVTVRFVREVESAFGGAVLYGMVDAAGNSIRYFASGGFYAEKGETFRIKGTVKSQEEYHGEKQTQLTRCKRMEVEVGGRGL